MKTTAFLDQINNGYALLLLGEDGVRWRYLTHS